MGRKEKKVGSLKEILALHGWTNSIEKWGAFSDSLREKNIQIKIPSIPGLTKKISQPWTLDDYIEWLKKQIGIKKVILLGHSNGGRIAIAFAAKYPNNVSKLILIDSAGIFHNELPIRIKRGLFKGFAFIGKKITNNERFRNILYKLTRERDYQKADKIQRQIMVNLISSDLTSALKKINIPTLIIWGKDDKTTPLSDGKLMNKLIKNSKLEVIKNSKHSPHLSHAEEVAKIIHEYL